MKIAQISLSFASILLLASLGCQKQPATAAAPTDQQITSGVQAKLQSESALAGQNIQASVNNGVVTLSGTTADAASRALAGNDAGSVAGVKTVVNNLEVQTAAAPPPPPAAPERAASRSSERRREQPVRRAPQPAPVETAAAPPPPPPAVRSTPPPPPPQPVRKTFTLGAGTTIPVRTSEALDSETAQANQTFHGTVAADVMRNGAVVLPRGTPVLGVVTDAKNAARFKGSSLLALQITRVDLGGNHMAVYSSTFSQEGKGRGKGTAEKVGGGAVLGAVIGAIAGGGKGAAIGSAVGAGAGAGVTAMTRGEQVHIPAETVINFALQQPLAVTLSAGATSGSYDPGLANRPQP